MWAAISGPIFNLSIWMLSGSSSEYFVVFVSFWIRSFVFYVTLSKLWLLENYSILNSSENMLWFVLVIAMYVDKVDVDDYFTYDIELWYCLMT